MFAFCELFVYTLHPVAAEPHFESLSEVVALKVECATPQAKHFLPTEQYEVQYRRVGHLPVNPWHSVNITGTPPLTTTYLEGLRKKTAYWVRVRAVSAVGPGRRWHMQQYITSGGEFDVPGSHIYTKAT